MKLYNFFLNTLYISNDINFLITLYYTIKTGIILYCLLPKTTGLKYFSKKYKYIAVIKVHFLYICVCVYVCVLL